MKNYELDYTNEYEVRNHIKTNVVPGIYEALVDGYGFGSDDYSGESMDDAWEIIDGLSDVIYNYQAKMVAQAFQYCPFNSVSDFTGEPFNSYNQMAFEIIYNIFTDKYSDEVYKEY